MNEYIEQMVVVSKYIRKPVYISESGRKRWEILTGITLNENGLYYEFRGGLKTYCDFVSMFENEPKDEE